MKAGTATKLVLNTLTTGAMIRLGKTYGNLMVDLRAWNDKLIDRSQRIVMETTGLGRDEARGVIDAADGKVKTAIVMARRRVSRDEAERLLEEHEGRLREIVGDPPPVRERMTERPMLGVGLMSGTSLDGVDAALVRIDGPTHATLLDFVTRPYDDAERAELRAALDPAHRPAPRRSPGCTSASPSGPRTPSRSSSPRPAPRRPTSAFIAFPGPDGLARAAHRHLAAGRARGPRRAVRRAGGERLPAARRRRGRAGRAAGADGRRAALRRRRSSRGCCSTSAGWRTSPTSPGARRRRACSPSTPVRAWPSSTAWRGWWTRAAPTTATGSSPPRASANEAVLAELLADPFFAAPPPKSTGRERFGDQYARELHRRVPGADGVATAVELTARSVAGAVGRWVPGDAEVVASRRRLPSPRADGRAARAALDALPRPPSAADASTSCSSPATRRRRSPSRCSATSPCTDSPGNVPAATGAAGSRVLGAVTPA